MGKNFSKNSFGKEKLSKKSFGNGEKTFLRIVLKKEKKITKSSFGKGSY